MHRHTNWFGNELFAQLLVTQLAIEEKEESNKKGLGFSYFLSILMVGDVHIIDFVEKYIIIKNYVDQI